MAGKQYVFINTSIGKVPMRIITSSTRATHVARQQESALEKLCREFIYTKEDALAVLKQSGPTGLKQTFSAEQIRVLLDDANSRNMGLGDIVDNKENESGVDMKPESGNTVAGEKTAMKVDHGTRGMCDDEEEEQMEEWESLEKKEVEELYINAEHPVVWEEEESMFPEDVNTTNGV